MAEKLFPAWPEPGQACVVCIREVVDEHLKDEMLNPRGMFLLAAECPSEVPVSKVHATQSEWYSLLKGAHLRGMFEHMAEPEVVRSPTGEKILNGAMGVDKWKKINGVDTLCELFISN